MDEILCGVTLSVPKRVGVFSVLGSENAIFSIQDFAQGVDFVVAHFFENVQWHCRYIGFYLYTAACYRKRLNVASIADSSYTNGL